MGLECRQEVPQIGLKWERFKPKEEVDEEEAGGMFHVPWDRKQNLEIIHAWGCTVIEHIWRTRHA